MKINVLTIWIKNSKTRPTTSLPKLPSTFSFGLSRRRVAKLIFENESAVGKRGGRRSGGANRVVEAVRTGGHSLTLAGERVHHVGRRVDETVDAVDEARFGLGVEARHVRVRHAQVPALVRQLLGYFLETRVLLLFRYESAQFRISFQQLLNVHFYPKRKKEVVSIDRSTDKKKLILTVFDS